MAKKVYLQGKAHYLRPYHLDTGENLDDNSEIKQKLMKTGGIYSALIELPFDNRDDAEEHLNSLGIPTNGLFGNLLKRIEFDGEKKVVYKVVRPHEEPNFEDPLLGPPTVIDEESRTWEPETLIGNGSDITVKLDVWQGNKATKIRWEAVRVDNLIPYEGDDKVGF